MKSPRKSKEQEIRELRVGLWGIIHTGRKVRGDSHMVKYWQR